jgi:CheY-like chemotaxis protein
MAHALVVDDESSVRGVISDLLEGMGHRVTEARDGLAALEAFEREEPDLVLCDVVMPRMNGFDLLQVLLPRIRNRVPFVFVSIQAGQARPEAAMFAEAFDYLAKPFRVTDVREAVERALAQRRLWVGSPPRTAVPTR